MSDVLARICADKRQHIQTQKSRLSAQAMMAAAETRNRSDPPRGFAHKLATVAADGAYALIAEIKRASPSRGEIRGDFDPTQLALAYQAGGASCLSVLTDVPYFAGDDRYLDMVRQAVALPVLRKDFMLDPYQIYESRALGADCILLIMAALDDTLAGEMNALAQTLGMDVLAETHDERELARAIDLPHAMIGVNNRNLKTLKVDLATTERLALLVPRDRLLVAESGLYRTTDLAQMRSAGARAFLVGESLMREADVASATRALLGSGAPLRQTA